MPAFLLPLLAGAAQYGVSEYQRNKRRKELGSAFEKGRPPAINFGTRRNMAMRQAGEGRDTMARGFAESQAARGVDDPGAAASAGRQFAVDAGQRLDDNYANIQDQEDAYKRAVAEWESRKAQAIAGLPDATDSLASGLETGMTAFQMANPNMFTTEYPEVQAPAQTPSLNFAPPQFDPRMAAPGMNALPQPKMPQMPQLGIRPPDQSRGGLFQNFWRRPQAQATQARPPAFTFRRPQYQDSW